MIPLPSRFPVNFTTSEGHDVDLLSPNDHKLLTKIQYATSADINFLLERLPLAQKKMKELTPFARASILKKAGALIKENEVKLAWLIAAEGGKPLKDAKVEVTRAQSTLDLCAEETLRLGGETIPMGRTSASVGHIALTFREAIGPVLAISAFNHPLNLLAHQVGSAIASGCAVVIKPAPSTPLCAFKLEKFLIEAGLPSECLFVVNADVSEIEKLVRSPAFDYVSFIGSAKVGWHLRSILAPGTRLGLEHGGQAPAIVREDADLELAVPLLIKSSFYHAGQVCISTQRIFVHEKRKEEFTQKFTEAAKKLIVGDARKETTDVGPLIRPREVARLKEWILEAKERGAKIVLGNEVHGENGQYLTPTVLADVPRNTRIMTEEAFGPIVCVNAYQDEKELLTYLNENPYVFESSLFTQDITHAFRIAQEISTMTLVINNHSAFRVDWMPFGGHKLSGLGMGGVKYMMEEMTRLKQVILKYQ